MKISVAMATYNGEKYIIEQLDSIRNQTRPVDELIIHDDCSSDNTINIVRKYIREYCLEDSWQVVCNERNLGYASNFIASVKDTTGDYIFFCDQDDIWLKDRVDKMVSVMESDEKIMMLGSEFEAFSCDKDAPQISQKVLDRFTGDGSLEHFKLQPSTVFIGSEGCTMCVRRTFFDKTLSFWVDGWAHDEYVWKLALCMDGCYVLHEKTLLRRMHAGNVSKRKMRDLPKRIKFFEELLVSHKQTLAFAEHIGLGNEEIVLLQRNIRATELRVELMAKRKIWNTVRLVFLYLDCYHSKKSILIELLMSLKFI